MKNNRFTRRKLLKGSMAAAAAASIPGLIEPAHADTKVLRARTNFRFQTMDPAHMFSHAENEVMRAIYPRLVRFKEHDWGWELEDAESIEQLGRNPRQVQATPGYDLERRLR